MADDERIKRITELARRVYGNQAVLEPVTRLSMSIAERGGWGVRCHGSVCIQVMGEHALDALEAALLVMLEDGVREAALFSSGGRFEQAMQKIVPHDWVEQLAAEYEERAALRDELARGARAADRNQNAADLAMWASHYRNLAAELRERAKGAT